MRQLERLLVDGGAVRGGWMSVESLLDSLLCLYDECCASPLRRDKNIHDYIEWGESPEPGHRGWDGGSLQGHWHVLGSLVSSKLG